MCKDVYYNIERLYHSTSSRRTCLTSSFFGHVGVRSVVLLTTRTVEKRSIASDDIHRRFSTLLSRLVTYVTGLGEGES